MSAQGGAKEISARVGICSRKRLRTCYSVLHDAIDQLHVLRARAAAHNTPRISERFEPRAKGRANALLVKLLNVLQLPIQPVLVPCRARIEDRRTHDLVGAVGDFGESFAADGEEGVFVFLRELGLELEKDCWSGCRVGQRRWSRADGRGRGRRG